MCENFVNKRGGTFQFVQHYNLFVLNLFFHLHCLGVQVVKHFLIRPTVFVDLSFDYIHYFRQSLQLMIRLLPFIANFGHERGQIGRTSRHFIHLPLHIFTLLIGALDSTPRVILLLLESLDGVLHVADRAAGLLLLTFHHLYSLLNVAHRGNQTADTLALRRRPRGC